MLIDQSSRDDTVGGRQASRGPLLGRPSHDSPDGTSNASVPGRGTRQRTVEAIGNAGSGLLLHPDPGRRPRPQTGPATGQDLPPADGRTRRRAPPGAVRGRWSAGRTRLGGAQPADAGRHLRHRRCPGHPGPGETDHHRQRPTCRSRPAADRRSTKTRPRNRSAQHAYQEGGRPSASRAQRRMTSHTHPDGRTPRGNQPNPLDRQHPITARRTRGTRLAHHRKHRRLTIDFADTVAVAGCFFHQVAADAGWRLDWSANPGRRPHRRARPPAAAVAPNRSAPGSRPPIHRLDPTTAQDTGGKRRQSTPGRRACAS